MSEMKAEFNEELQDLQQKSLKQLMQASELRSKLELSEKRYEKEKNTLENMRQRYEEMTTAMIAQSKEHRQLTLNFNKLEAKLAKKSERLNRFETDLAKELEDRIGDVVARNSTLTAEVSEFMDKLAQKEL